ncbi:serine/threonine protein kinase [Candidatus Micrarchaeota archaeon]|nr:serine/threonine protein kinase [Candidatus Micrarchaeota archaeon]
MQKSGDGSGGPIKPPKKTGSRVLGVRTIQGVLPDQYKLPEPVLEALAKIPAAPPKRASEPPPAIEAEESLDIEEISMREGEKYLLESVLGQGGFGIVYRGTHLVESLQRKGTYVIDDPVAIKVISFNEADLQSAPEGPEKAREELNRRFEVEVMLAKKLKHPNIVAIETFAQLSDGRPFYVMELLNGMDLGAIMHERRCRNEGPLEWGRLKPVMLQVCSALDAAHNYEEKGVRKPIVHRDIKPENIFIVTGKGGEWQVKVLDFGLAKLVAPSNPDATKKGEGVGGSPWYMSPEQAWGLTVDERSDIWSVGATMYELISGRPPFDFEILEKGDAQTSDEYFEYRNQKWAEIRDRLFNERPKAFQFVNPDIRVPEEVEEIVFKCLEKKPERRYQSVAELKEAIEKVNGVANGTGAQNGKAPGLGANITSGGEDAAQSAGSVPEYPATPRRQPSYEPPVIVNDPDLLDLMEADAEREEATQVTGKGKTPQPADAGPAGAVPDLSEDHPTLPRYEKTEIVRIRGAAQDASKRPTMQQAAGKRRKFSKWLIIGTIAGSVAAAGIGTGLVYNASRSDSAAAARHETTPVKGFEQPAPSHESAAPASRDAGAEAVREAASADAVAPLVADAGAAQAEDAEATQEHTITLNFGIPGVQVYVWDTPACRSEADGRCAITLPAQSDEVGLRFRKRGYNEVRRNVVPDQDREIRIRMERAAGMPPGNGTKVPGHPPRITTE